MCLLTRHRYMEALPVSWDISVWFTRTHTNKFLPLQSFHCRKCCVTVLSKKSKNKTAIWSNFSMPIPWPLCHFNARPTKIICSVEEYISSSFFKKVLPIGQNIWVCLKKDLFSEIMFKNHSSRFWLDFSNSVLKTTSGHQIITFQTGRPRLFKISSNTEKIFSLHYIS